MIKIRLSTHPSLLLQILVWAVVGVAFTACTPTAAPNDTPDTATVQPPSARNQPETQLGIYSPEQHALYDGIFRLRGQRIFQAGTLNDPTPWDHMGDDASNLREVGGTIEIDVNEITNTGTFRAELELPEGNYVVELDEVVEFNPCQDGGVAAFLFEHGDAGCGDSNWPKSLLYVAGWGTGRALLNGEELYSDYQIHFMVTQGMRNRETLEVLHSLEGLEGAEGNAGAVNPAAQQLDFYIRSPEKNDQNHPGREVFDHFFAMEVTWQ